MTAALIGLDWGTSSLRAYRLAADGAILERRAAGAGILNVEDGDFDAAFLRAVGDWLAEGVPVLLCGMIGSRQGWLEAPYVACPAGANELAAALMPATTGSGARIAFVPGMSRTGADGVPDVMRGEETQVVGALQAAGAGARVLLLPGTHSKWVRVEDGRIVWFATFMTGELFAVLARHSILGRLMEGEAEDDAAFGRGLAYGADSGRDGLLKRLFSARTLALLGDLPATGVRSYLSGLLIGTEIAEARRALAADIGAVTVIGGAELGSRYRLALARQGIGAEAAGEETTARGQAAIARAAGLIG